MNSELIVQIFFIISLLVFLLAVVVILPPLFNERNKELFEAAHEKKRKVFKP
jgi:cbb3-type cytochrome oxidase subunit 3